MNKLQLLAHLCGNLLPHALSRKMRIGVLNECGCGLLVVVNHGVGAPVGDLTHRLIPRAHHQIACNKQIGFSRGNANRLDIVLCAGDAHMTYDCAKFLREPCLIQCGATFAFYVCGHGNQRGDG